MKDLFLKYVQSLMLTKSRCFLLLILCATHISTQEFPELISTWISSLLASIHATNFVKPMSTICFYIVLFGMLCNIIWYVKNDMTSCKCSYGTLEYEKLIQNGAKRLGFEERIQNTGIFLFFLDILNMPKASILEKVANHFSNACSLELLVCILLALVFQLIREKRFERTA